MRQAGIALAFVTCLAFSAGAGARPIPRTPSAGWFPIRLGAAPITWRAS